jgi:FlaG/FlaF family flagellin (archaellin)
MKTRWRKVVSLNSLRKNKKRAIGPVTKKILTISIIIQVLRALIQPVATKRLHPKSNSRDPKMR